MYEKDSANIISRSVRVCPRVQQLRRTELAGELKAPNVSAHPTKSRTSRGPREENGKGNYEKDTANSIGSDVHLRPRIQQLRRTELARRVGSAQCLRSPHEVTYFAGTP